MDLKYFLIFVACFIPMLNEIKSEEITDSTLIFTTNSSKSIFLSLKNAKCLKCKLTNLGEINKLDNLSISLDTYYPAYYVYFKLSDTNEQICESYSKDSINLNENSSYSIRIDLLNDNNYKCQIKTLNPGNQTLYAPFKIIISIIMSIVIFYSLTKLAYKKYSLRFSNRLLTPNLEQTIINEDQEGLLRPIKKSNRIKSIDVLRGICLSIMVFVNFGAGGYSILDHAVWNGLNLADTVFPLLIYLMGVSIPLSFRTQTREIENFKLSKVLKKIFKRTFLLFFFGLVTSNSSDLKINQLRIMGVLQRFAISFFINSLIELFSLKLSGYQYIVRIDNEEKFIELFQYTIQWLISSFFILIWLIITFLLPLDNCKPGYIGPGGLHENGSHYNCTGGAAGFLDRMILGENHIYQYPTCRIVYKTQIGYDPEGLLGCLTSFVLTYLGIMTGHILIHYKEDLKRVARFIFYGLLFGLIGLILCKFSIEDGWIPINKNLWSLSFILVMGSIGLFSLSILYILIDVYGLYTGTPFLYMGRNSIVVYIGHIIFGNYFPNFNFGNSHLLILLNNIYWVLIWCLVTSIMNFKKIYINF